MFSFSFSFFFILTDRGWRLLWAAMLYKYDGMPGVLLIFLLLYIVPDIY